MKDLHIHIVAAQFNLKLVDRLVKGATYCLNQSKNTTWSVHWVNGAFELPLMASKLIEVSESSRFPLKRDSSTCDGIVALGVVIRGKTPHFDYICQGCTQGLMHLMTTHAIPIGFGVVMTNSYAQAHARSSLDFSRAMEHDFVSSTSQDSESTTNDICDATSNKGFEAASAVLQSLNNFHDLSYT